LSLLRLIGGSRMPFSRAMHDPFKFQSALIDGVLEETLRVLVSRLATSPAPDAREERHRAMRYLRAVLHWALVPPTKAQRDSMADLVGELETKTRHLCAPPAPESRPTVRMARISLARVIRFSLGGG